MLGPEDRPACLGDLEAQKPQVGLGQGKAELDFTLAFYQLVRKAPGNLFRESNLGLSPEQEAPGQLGVVLAYPAPCALFQIPVQFCHPLRQKKKN